jgi:hypothetical protein
VLVLLTREEPWLAAVAAVAVLLGLGCLAIAAASGPRFAPYGLAVLIAVPLFGAATIMLRGIDSPEVQPVAVILKSGKALCGTYVGESYGRLWIGRVELSELASTRRPHPRRGRLLPVDSDAIAERAIGVLQPVTRAQDQALALRDDLLNARGDNNLEAREATCVAKKPPERLEPSPQRDLAERYQPELILDRKDGFWPIPVRTLFSIQDRKAAACRLVAADDEGDACGSQPRATCPGREARGRRSSTRLTTRVATSTTTS